MVLASLSPIDILTRKLRSIAPLSEDDIFALESLPITPRHIRSGQDLARQGDRPSQSCVVLEGWACRYKLLDKGKRQIMAIHVPGDVPDLLSLYLPVMDHNIATLTDATIAFLPHAALHDLLTRHPGLMTIFWRDTLIDAAIFREWVVNVGQRPAPERIAHLLCEVFARLEAIGLAHEIGGRRSFMWPITQMELADATGLSSVHVNRTLQELRAKGLIALAQGRAAILDWPRLTELAGFVPDYLSLEPRRGSAHH